MAYQPIYLGTPNNNDGDSLYAGGAKINANFLEIYNGIAGGAANSIRINLGSGQVAAPVTSQTLRWSAIQQAFIPASSNMLLSMADNGSSGLILTNANGKAGADLEYTDYPNKLVLFLNGRSIFDVRTTTTGSVALTRGTMMFGMGNPRATSLAITTRGVAIGGADGLTVYRNAAEENAASSLVISTGSSGAILYDTPLTSGYLSSADSSNAIVNSGFVQNAITRRGYALSSVSIIGTGAITGGGALNNSQTLSLNPYAFMHHCEGFLYSFTTFGGSTYYIQVEPGSATHYSYSVSGATVISQTSVLSTVVSSTKMTRLFTGGAAWGPNNSYASLDTIAVDTWYYIYLIANNTTGAADFVISTSRDYAGVVVKLGAVTTQYSVIRRIGAFRTSAALSGAGVPIPEPFITRKIDVNTIRLEYLQASGMGVGYNSSLVTTSNAVGQVQALTVLPASGWATGLFSSSVATTATASMFSSVLIKYLPPLPGITADMEIVSMASTGLCTIAFFADPWISSATTYYNASTNLVPAPVMFIRPNATMVTSIDVRTVPISPEVSMLSDTQVGASQIWTTSYGVFLRYASMQLATGNNGIAAPVFLGWNTKGFNFAR
jgi:hypothetical protein